MSMPLSGNFGFPHLKFTLKQNQSYFYIEKLGVLLLHCWVCHFDVLMKTLARCGSRICQGAPASESESSRCKEAESCEQSEQYAVKVQGLLKGLGSFWVFIAQICILPHSRDSFSLIVDIYFNN